MKLTIFLVFLCLCVSVLNAHTNADTSKSLKLRNQKESEKATTFDIYDENVLDEIGYGYLTTDAIEMFLNVAGKLTNRTMISVACAQIEGVYAREDFHKYIDEDDLQILFDGNFNDVGHYICVYYKAADRTVYVFDSMKFEYLSKDIKQIIDDRYPDTPVKYIRPKTKQPDGCSCGVFSIAYATHLILGLDPAITSLKLDKNFGKRTVSLRKHIAKMITHKKLRPFPTA